MFGKIIDNKLVFAEKVIKTETGKIDRPTNEQLRANGWKEVEYSEKPTYNKEEEKLVEIYLETDNANEESRIVVSYNKVPLTNEEHDAVIQQEIIEEEMKITARRQREFDLKYEGAREFVESIENNIKALRLKLRS